MSKEFKVIIDTREREPWDFSEEELCTSQEVRKLDTGDYTIEGLEEKLCIERKGSLVEFANNVVQDRFWAEMDRMLSFPLRFLILEFSLPSLLNYPAGLGLAQRILDKIKITPSFLLKNIAKLQLQYGVNVIFAGNRYAAEKIALTLFKNVEKD